MKKLFIILLRKDVELIKVERHSCQILWTTNETTYLVTLFDDGKAYASAQKQNIHYLNPEEISLFCSTFFNVTTQIETKNSFNGTAFNITKSRSNLPNDSFSLLYKDFRKNKVPASTSIINLKSK